jgi:signal transduction histidine kinase
VSYPGLGPEDSDETVRKTGRQLEVPSCVRSRRSYVVRMLRDFLAVNRDEILAQARARVALRGAPLAQDEELLHGLPVFLDQLCEALRKEKLHQVVDHSEIQNSAGQHGDHLFHAGLTVAGVVNSYGDLCQVITGLAVEQHASIGADDFQTLNLCLDDATAGAVSAYSRQRERALSDEGTERLGVLAHELRNALNSAILAFGLIKKGVVATGGSTGAMLDRSHVRLQSLIDRSLADVRLDAGLLNLERAPVWEVIEEAEIGASVVAQTKGLRFEVTTADRMVFVEVDRPILVAAIANLLQNALKFTRPDTTVRLHTSTTTSRVLIEVEDECGGLPPGEAENLLRPFVQKGRDRSGVGLGLSICMKAVKMMAGELRIRDIPGKGCIFTIDLPKQLPPPTSIHALDRKSEDGCGVSVGQDRALDAVAVQSSRQRADG